MSPRDGHVITVSGCLILTAAINLVDFIVSVFLIGFNLVFFHSLVYSSFYYLLFRGPQVY